MKKKKVKGEKTKKTRMQKLQSAKVKRPVIWRKVVETAEPSLIRRRFIGASMGFSLKLLYFLGLTDQRLKFPYFTTSV